MTLLLSTRSGRVGDLLDVARAGAELLLVVDSAELSPPVTGSDDVANESDAPGATVSDALNSIGGAVATMNTDTVANASTAPGATASDALDSLQQQFDTLAADTAGTGLHATGVNPQQLTTRIRPRLVQICDYFISGNVVSGGIGALGWTLLGVGTPAVVRGNCTFGTSVASRITLSATNVAGDRSSLILGDTEARQIMRPADINILQFVVATSLLNRRVFFGLSDNFALNPTAAPNALGFLYDTTVGGTVWQMLTRAASVGAPAPTTGPVPNLVPELLTLLRLADDSYEFYSNGTLIGTISAGVADTSAMNVGFRIEATAANSVSINVGYFGLQAVGSAQLDDDNFLQG